MALGQCTITGTRVPPSNALYFPPLRLPAGSCPFSNSSALSSYPSSTTGPLSLERIINVFWVNPILSRASSNWPTLQSNCAIASPRSPILFLPRKRLCGKRGTCTSLVAKYIKKGSSLCCLIKSTACAVMESAIFSSFHNALPPPFI